MQNLPVADSFDCRYESIQSMMISTRNPDSGHSLSGRSRKRFLFTRDIQLDLCCRGTDTLLRSRRFHVVCRLYCCLQSVAHNSIGRGRERKRGYIPCLVSCKTAAITPNYWISMFSSARFATEAPH